MRSGWFRDSYRHSLAARGIKTNFKIKGPRLDFAAKDAPLFDRVFHGKQLDEAEYGELQQKLNRINAKLSKLPEDGVTNLYKEQMHEIEISLAGLAQGEPVKSWDDMDFLDKSIDTLDQWVDEYRAENSERYGDDDIETQLSLAEEKVKELSAKVEEVKMPKFRVEPEIMEKTEIEDSFHSPVSKAFTVKPYQRGRITFKVSPGEYIPRREPRVKPEDSAKELAATGPLVSKILREIEEEEESRVKE